MPSMQAALCRDFPSVEGACVCCRHGCLVSPMLLCSSFLQLHALPWKDGFVPAPLQFQNPTDPFKMQPVKQAVQIWIPTHVSSLSMALCAAEGVL